MTNSLSIAGALIGYLYVIGFLAVMYYNSGRHRDRSTLLWVVANLLTLLSVAAFAFDERRFGPWGVLLRNVLVATAGVSVVYVLLNAAHRRPSTWLFAAVLVVFVSLQIYYTLIAYATIRRILLMDTFTVLLSLYSIYELLAAYRQEPDHNYLLFVGAFALMVVAYLYRAFFTLGAVNLLEVEEIRSHVFLVSLLANSAFLLLWNVVLYVVLSRRGASI